jgi:tRNA threonylcarbamoyl adenosine modification protein (Sua5/YciO/YrdC/YwlC family)
MSVPALDEAIEAVRRGDLIVFPTDTVYGIGARPDDPAATRRLFEAKRRRSDLQLPVLVASREAARTVALFDDRAERAARLWWPGPVTLVLPRSSESAGWELGGDFTTIGLRVPQHVLAVTLLEAAGPMAVTSANLSGQPTATTCDDLVEAFGDLVSVYICEPEPLLGQSSTVVDLTGPSVRVLRAGAASAESIRAALNPIERLLDSRPPT